MITRDEPSRLEAPTAWGSLPLLLTARSVGGDRWLLAPDREERAARVDVDAFRRAEPQEAARIVSLARLLLLAPAASERRLDPGEVGWLLEQPDRVACLIDLLAAAEDGVRMLTTPLRVAFTPSGQVRWRFATCRSPLRTGSGLRSDVR